MPALVLRAGQRVEVDDRVEPVARGALDRTIEEREAFLAQLERTHVVLEVVVVHRQPHEVHAERCQKCGVGVRVEHVEEPVEETRVRLVAERAAKRVAVERLRRREPGDEVLHVHPAAEPDAP